MHAGKKVVEQKDLMEKMTQELGDMAGNKVGRPNREKGS